MRFILILIAVCLNACESTAAVSGRISNESTIIVPEQVDPNSTDARAPKERVIYFEVNKTDIRPEYVEVITQHAFHITLNPVGRMHIVGHTDNRGKRAFNIALGDERAKAVEHMMLALGVDSKQLRRSSYGEELPADYNYDRNEVAWAKSRRVEILYDPDITMEP